MDGYHNFVKNQNLVRYLVEINVEIKGNLVNGDKIIELPVKKQESITTHLLQFKTIKVPTRNDIESSLVTDIDFFMSGNPHTI